MSKTPSNKLFKIVKSMSAMEKRYFKVIANKKGDNSNKYLVLFDAIDAQKEFDDDALLEQVYKVKSISKKNYSELKGYLYEVILKTLQSFDEKSSMRNKLSNHMHNVDVLFKRGHMQLCKEELKKAKKTATQFEEFSTLYEIAKWEKWIAHTMIDVNFLHSELGRIEEEEKQYLEQLNLLSKYRNLFLELYLKIKSREGLDDIHHIVNSDLINKENFNSHRSTVLYYRSKALLAFIQKDNHAFGEHSRVLLEIMESKPHFLKEEVAEYISALHNYCMFCIVKRDFDTLHKTNEKIKTVTPLNIDDRIKIHLQYMHNHFLYCIRTGQFEEARNTLPEHFNKIKLFNTTVFDDQHFLFHYAYIYFGCGDYDEALYHLNNWLDMPSTIDKPKLQMLSRVFNLILHYELGNILLVSSLIKSTYRFLKKENQLQEIEKAFLNFIKTVIKAQGKREVKECFQKFKISLMNITDSEEATISVFDLMSWVDSKLINMSFAEIVKNKWEKTKVGISSGASL